MKAVIVHNPGPSSTLHIEETDTPRPGPNEILVKIKATALNRADLLQRRGWYDPPEGESPILGLEMAGVVDECGSGVTRWKTGERVFGLLPGGGYAEYAVLNEQMAMLMPKKLTFEQAAALPETFLTAFQALHWSGDLQHDEKILIHAGASGVGTAAIQLARFKTSHIYITAGSRSKINYCLNLGAKHGINYKKEAFEDVIKKQTDNQGVDLIIDFIGADYWNANLKSLGLDGRLVLLGLLGGYEANTTNLARLLKKRIRIQASTLRSRSQDYKIKLTRAFQQNHLADFENETLQPVIDRVFSWKQVEQAHERMAANKNCGKIVSKID